MIAVVHELVPKRVQFIDIVVILEWDLVATFVSVGKLAVVVRLAMQGLHDVTHVVDNQAEAV